MGEPSVVESVCISQCVQVKSLSLEMKQEMVVVACRNLIKDSGCMQHGMRWYILRVSGPSISVYSGMRSFVRG